MKLALKLVAQFIFLALTALPALLTGFGRLEPVFLLFAHLFALAPGLPGDFLRIAYYRLTLRQCSLDSRIEFGSFFAHSQVSVGHGVYIGPFCVLGQTRIGDRTQIASGVQILSGRRQHARTSAGAIEGSNPGNFEEVSIGADCWIGAAAIIMAAVGPNCTIGAGSVVVKPIPANATAVGSPARVIASGVAGTLT